MFVKRIILAGILFSLIGLADREAGAASYKEWRKAMDRADEAMTKRDFETAVTIFEKSAEEAATLTSASYCESAGALAAAQMELKRYDQALLTINGALEMLKTRPVATQTAMLQGFMAMCLCEVYYRAERFDEALKAGASARAILQAAAGKFHPQLFRIYGMMGDIYFKRKQLAEAEDAYQTALRFASSLTSVAPTAEGRLWGGSGYGRSDEGVLLANAALARVYLAQKRYGEAKEVAKKSLKAAERDYGKKHPAVVIALRSLAAANLKLGERAEFEQNIQRAYEMAAAKPGLRPGTMEILFLKLAVDVQEGGAEKANQTVEKIMTVWDVQNFGAELMGTLAMEGAKDQLGDDWAKIAEMQTILRNAVAAHDAVRPVKVAQLTQTFAEFSMAEKQTNLARLNYEEAVKAVEETKDLAMLALSLEKLADFYIAAGQGNKAVPVFERITEILKAKYGNDSRVAESMVREVALLKKLGRAEEAAALNARTQEVWKRALAPR